MTLKMQKVFVLFFFFNELITILY